MTPEQLKATRERLGYTQGDFAALLGLHRHTWAKWERGEQAPPAAALSLVSAVAHMADCGCLDSWRA